LNLTYALIWDQHIEKDPALARRFQPILVQEPSVEDTITMLRGCTCLHSKSESESQSQSQSQSQSERERTKHNY
jgi:ATP-dependent Clp protease ATP-binding subunit ClpA